MSRRRQRNVEGGRQRLCEVWVSPEQAAVLLAAAARDQVTPSRFLAEAGVAVAGAEHADGVLETPTQRRAQVAQLYELRHQIATAAVEVKRVGTNVNQIAKGVHTGQPVPVEEMRGFLVDEREFLARARKVCEDIDALIEATAAQGVDV